MPLFGGPNLDDVIFQLKFSTKQLEREAKRAEKEEKALRAKVKKAIKEKNIEFAQVHAESAIRKKNECLGYMRLASRVDAVASRVKSAQSMKAVTKEIGSTSKALESAMKSMNLEKITGVMDKFESQFEHLDVHSQVMESAIGDSMATQAPSSQIDDLIQKVAAENGLEQEAAMLNAPTASDTIRTEERESNELSSRLAALRN